MWFEQDEYDEPGADGGMQLPELPDVLKPKQDLNLDQFINRYFVDRKSYFDAAGASESCLFRILDRFHSSIWQSKNYSTCTIWVSTVNYCMWLCGVF